MGKGKRVRGVRVTTIMRGFLSVALLLLIAVVTQAKEYDLIKRGYYCKGKEPYKGRKSIKACANACRGSSALFIIGTNEFGNNRCYKDGCKCYCQYATQPHCLVLTKHTGYDLYAFDGNGYKKIMDAHYCKGKEPYKGRKRTLQECADACRGVTDTFIYGTNAHGNKRCYKDGCKCYCQINTEIGCQNLTPHTGYNLYNIGKKAKGIIG